MSYPVQQNKYAVEIYQIDVTNSRLIRFDSITTFKNLSYDNTLDAVGAASFDLSVQDPKASATNLVRFRNVVAIKRNGGIVWAGPITDINGSYTDVKGYLTISCNSWLYHLQARLTDAIKYYPAQDISLIAWDLINTAQTRTNGYLGITQGSTPTSITRDRSYEYKPMSDCLIEMSQIISGFDFDFTYVTNSNNKLTGVLFNTYPNRMGTIRKDLNPFTVGRNVKKVEITTSGQPIYNYSTMTGAGTGENLYTSQIEYANSELAFTRREVYQSVSDAALATTVSYYNAAYLNTYSVESALIDLNLYQNKYPLLGDYNIGDTVFLNSAVGSSYLNFTNKPARVVKIQVQVDDQGAETIIPRLQMLL